MAESTFDKVRAMLEQFMDDQEITAQQAVSRIAVLLASEIDNLRNAVVYGEPHD